MGRFKFDDRSMLVAANVEVIRVDRMLPTKIQDYRAAMPAGRRTIARIGFMTPQQLVGLGVRLLAA